MMQLQASRSRGRWLALLALLLAAGATVGLVAAAGLRSLLLLVACLVGAGTVLVAATWWFLSRSDAVRTVAATLAAATVGVLIGLLARAGLLAVVVACVLLWSLAAVVGRAALARAASARAAGAPQGRPRGAALPAPGRPWLVMNPRSGGGTVTRLGLDAAARALGAEVVLLGRPGTADVTTLAERAVAAGADLLGVAGGDGTQALVAEVAARHGLPFLVVPAGTRNHFALDLGLDVADPRAALDALADGEEVTVDLGRVGGRTFVNNASFGAYAAVVASPAYRDDKIGTALDLLPAQLHAAAEDDLRVRVGPVRICGPRAVLVSNNPYGRGDLAGLGRRAALDGGVLGVLALTVSGAGEGVRLLRGRPARTVWRGSATQVTVAADRGTVPVGIDGESLALPSPVDCWIEPGALRVRLPRTRPGAGPVRPGGGGRAVLRLALRGAAAS